MPKRYMMRVLNTRIVEDNRMNIYQEHGYENRQHYLEYLAEEYDATLWCVEAMADLLGSEEDFDGLVSMVQGAEGMV